jgi:hypothetical protein
VQRLRRLVPIAEVRTSQTLVLYAMDVAGVVSVQPLRPHVHA